MRTSRTLALYMTREMILYGLVGFAAVSVVLVSQNLLRRLDELTAVGFTLADLGIVIRCLFPMLAAYAIPVSLLFGVTLAVRRLMSDSEIIAMRACGVGLPALLGPNLLLGIALSGLSGYLLLVVEHDARKELIRLFNAVAARGSILTSGEFSGIGQRVIYVSERDRDNRLAGIMISDPTRARPFLIFAEHGRFSLDEETSSVHLTLSDGELHLTGNEQDEERYRRVLFDSFDYSFSVAGLLSDDVYAVRPKQMRLGELRDVVARARAGEAQPNLPKDPIRYELEIQRRLGLPFAPLVFALAAVPLALLGKPSSRAWGPMLCVILAFLYYAFVTLFQFLASKGLMAPFLVFWIPNAGVAALAAYMIYRTTRGAGR